MGQYEKIVGIACGEVDPSGPHNAMIQDIALAPRNSRGMFEHSTDVYILRPLDQRKGNQVLFYDVVNRGNKIALAGYNVGAAESDDPANNAARQAKSRSSGPLHRADLKFIVSRNAGEYDA